jgi:hypothetical protein
LSTCADTLVSNKYLRPTQYKVCFLFVLQFVFGGLFFFCHFDPGILRLLGIDLFVNY